jgi:hypothetical protein
LRHPSRPTKAEKDAAKRDGRMSFAGVSCKRFELGVI